MILLAVSMITLCSTTSRPDWSSSLYIFSILLCQMHDKRETHKFKDESTSEIPRDGFFASLHDIQKNPSGITAFRKLKCPDPSMIPLPAEVKEWLQKSIWLTSITCWQKYRSSRKFVTWGHTRVTFMVKMCTFERSNEKLISRKLKYIFTQKLHHKY